eukprot:g645.t1
MLRSVVITALLLLLHTELASAQTYGSGLGKTTYSVSDGKGTVQWMLSLLPTQHDTPNGAETCGEVGRARIATAKQPAGMCYLKSTNTGVGPAPSYNVPMIAALPKSNGDASSCEYTIGSGMAGTSLKNVSASSPQECCAACTAAAGCVGSTFIAGASSGFTTGFGIHAVHVTNGTRPFGAMSNLQVEKALDAKFEALYAGGGYDAFLDFTSGHWVASLDPYTTTFDAIGVKYVPLSWSANGHTYYSVIVRVHTSMVLIEMMSETCTACAASSSTIAVTHPRYYFNATATPASVFGPLDDASSARPLFHPARVSWPTSSLARDRKFFVDAGAAHVLAQMPGANADAAQTDVYDFTTFANVATMQFHLVERPAGNTTGSFAIGDFETVMLDTHKSVMSSDVCGFDQWLDNHLGVGCRATNWSIGRLQTVCESLGLKYHVLKAYSDGDDDESKNSFNVYMSAPNGLCMQINSLPNGNYTPSAPVGGGSIGGLCSIGPDTCPNKTHTTKDRDTKTGRLSTRRQ